MAGSGITKTLVWILMGLLVIGLGGFGATNLSGNVRSIGAVGETDIDVTTYARALQNEIRALEAERGEPISFARAQALGVDQAVLSRLVSAAALENETDRVGISIGDVNLRNQIIEIPAFQGIDGSFDREAYAFALQQAGMNEGRFESNIRSETARTLLQAAVVSGVQVPTSYMDAMLTYLSERRSIAFATLDRNDLATGLPVPSEQDLKTYHQGHLPDFTTPETKKITYAWMTPTMILDTVEVDEVALREAYADREAEFNQPERRLVERLVFPHAEAAQTAMARLDQGILFEMLVSERGLDLADVDMGDVSAADLGPAADVVFGADVGTVVGPAETDLGPAIFRVNAVLAAETTSFEEAMPELRAALAGDRARRVIDAQIDTVDDLLAGGATLEEIANETDLVLGQIDWHPGISDEIAAYGAFRTAAAEVTEADYPAVAKLEDDGIFALRLDGIDEPRIQPLEDVRDAVVQGWRAQATIKALRAEIEGQVTELQAGKSFDDLGLAATVVRDLTRRSYQADAPAEFIETVFGMEKGEVRVIEGNGRLFVLKLDNVLPPAEEDEDLRRLRDALRDQVAADLSQDLFQVLADDIRTRAGVTLDQAAMNAVHSNFN
ncbi:peptidyl-prolyl cis-trans isomerase D [Roseovarius marisflavi]|uniref:Peptidyl-prolyl cis-trans isomerase D n=1 Tax=Roseovarius marisflavi TaxID=1054996 RepID=A0A1M7AHH6_9RHOB|nr:peptidyl-prolyl cis-trans isomerase [Roseovarius marisflavi]SHL42087.1 peptidyl-prolyl cis-trans isomerase D [Roseovarius marisflavi]